MAMEKRSSRLEPIQELMDLKEKNAARRVAECRRTLEQNKTRLAELTTYRNSYLQQDTVPGQIDPIRLQEKRLFLDKLNFALSEQEKLVAQHQDSFDHAYKEWLSSKTHANAMEKAVDRFRHSEQVSDSRREQKAEDDSTSTLSARKS